SKERHERGLKYRPSLEEANFVVRDQWLKAGRHSELISFILENFDSGNCDEFMKPLLQILIQNEDSRSYKRLWKGVLRHRIETTRSYFSYLKANFPAITVNDLDAVDLRNFKEFSSQETLLRQTAFLRRSTLSGISEYIRGLEQLKVEESEIEWATKLFQNVSSMQKPSPKPSTDKRKIDEEVFWQLIERSRRGES